MNRDQKTAVVDEIAGQIKAADAIFAVDYRGLSVSQAADLRAKLRDVDAQFRIVKNSLTERAADQAGIDALKPMLVGPTALTLVHGDAALAAKALNDTARSLNLLEFKGGLLNGSVLSPDDVRSIARLPSREVLQGQLVATIAAPLTGLVRGLNALIVGLAIQLKAIADMDPPVLTAAPPAPAPTVTDAAPAEPAAETQPEPEAEAPAAPEADAPAEPEAEAPAEPEAQAAAEPLAEAPAEPAAEAQIEAAAQPRPADAVEPEAEAVTEAPEPEVQPEPAPMVEPPVEPEVAPPPAEPEIEPEPEPVVEPPVEPVVDPPAAPEAPVGPQAEAPAVPDAEAPVEPVAEVSESQVAPEPDQQSEPDAASDAAPSE